MPLFILEMRGWTFEERRQYFPKGTNLSLHSLAELDRVAVRLNGRPRERLDRQTPLEAFNDLLAANVSP